jgi:glycosyltransferase involved in cell wall biosynthesis
MEVVFRKLGERRVEWIVFGGAKGETSLPVQRVGKVFGAELAQVYSSAHIVFMPSWYESFPLPPLEAMACGTAVITTRYGTEDYAEHMANAWVVEPRKPDLLAEAIIELGSDATLMCRLAEAGVETARRFTWQAAAERLESTLWKLVLSHQSTMSRFGDISKLLKGELDVLGH